jgi:hypothetical protein
MKNFLFIFLSLFISLNSFSQEYILKFKVNSKSELVKLTNMISIDNYKNGEVIAYANLEEFEEFKKLGYSYQLLPHPAEGKVINMATTVAQMANWDRYPTYSVYLEMMNNFAINYPNLCQIVNIGTSVDGRQLLAVKISDNVTQHETEPEFFYTSSIHGDETTAFVLLLRFADWLLSNYGTDADATYIVNNFEVYINPAANPDGTYAGGNSTVASATRSNSNYVDLNRDYPDPRIGMNAPYEQETQFMMDFAQAHHFVMSTNFHGGAEVFNYPWDTWDSFGNTHADDGWFNHIGVNYVTSARVNNSNYMTDVVSTGVTEGGDWYVITGGRQDYMTYFQHGREVTLEISSEKLLSSDLLPTWWTYNYQSLIDYLKEAGYGFNGTVKNTNGNPLNAKIEIMSHDHDNSWAITDPINGDYYRPIAPGTYSVSYSSEGYISQTVDVTVTGWKTTTIKNIVLQQAQLVTVNGTITEEGTGNPLSGVKIELLGTSIPTVFSNVDGTYTIQNVFEGTHQIKASKNGYTSETQTVNISVSNYIFDFVLAISNAISFESDVPAIFTFGGNSDWYRTNTDSYEGDYSMRSGNISDNQTSLIQAELNILTAGNITFYKKVSSESGYDYLRFYIDGIQKGEWSGDVLWGLQSYSVTTGVHIFKWVYSKDGSVNGGSDCSWVDFIEFPTYQQPATYTVTFNVSDGNNPISDANVIFNSQNINTNTYGQAVFTEVSPGNSLPWSVSKTGYITETGNLNVLNDNYTQNVTLSQLTYNVTFIISDGSQPIQNADVTFNSENLLTDYNGIAIFTNISPGTALPYSVSKTGYNTFNGQLNVTNQNLEQNIILSESVSVNVILSFDGMRISPNPANNLIKIDFCLPQTTHIFMGLFDYNGKLIRILANSLYESGNNSIDSYCTDSNGKILENGIYFCKLYFLNKTITKKLIIIR